MCTHTHMHLYCHKIFLVVIVHPKAKKPIVLFNQHKTAFNKQAVSARIFLYI